MQKFYFRVTYLKNAVTVTCQVTLSSICTQSFSFQPIPGFQKVGTWQKIKLACSRLSDSGEDAKVAG